MTDTRKNLLAALIAEDQATIARLAAMGRPPYDGMEARLARHVAEMNGGAK